MMTTDTTTHDLTIALRSTLSMIEWILVRDKKRLGDQDVKKHLKEIDLLRVLLSDADE